MGMFASLYAERVFPWALDKILRGRVIDGLTREALAPATGEVLEIGFGSGRSLPHYGPGVQALWTVEPSHGMSRRATERIASAPFPVHTEAGAGESLPFQDARFDSVSLILTLCSVSRPLDVLKEARRVLKPGGTLVMMEHVHSDEQKWQTWQRRLEPVQKLLGCGCHLTRDPEPLAIEAGFAWQRLTRQVVQKFPGKPELFPILIGHAVAA
jgi:ubiquinone/menaquinone biosynthesis C-methylase UbiE